MMEGDIYKELKELQEQLRAIECSIKEIKMVNERILALGFLSAISHVGLDLYTKVRNYWEASPLFVNALNLAIDRAKAAFAQAESLRQASFPSDRSMNIAIHPCHDQEHKGEY